MSSPGLSGDAGVRGLTPCAVQAVLSRGQGGAHVWKSSCLVLAWASQGSPHMAVPY